MSNDKRVRLGVENLMGSEDSKLSKESFELKMTAVASVNRSPIGSKN